MTNNVINLPPGGDHANRMPSALPEPAMSSSLSGLVALALEGSTTYLGRASYAEVSEATVLLAQYEALCRPAPAHAIRGWMEAVNMGVSNPVDEIGFQTRCMLVVDTSGDLPVACWTAETRRAFARRGDKDATFFPSDAAVDQFLRPIGTRLLRKRDVLRRMRDAAAMERSPPPPEYTPGEKAAISERFRAQMNAVAAERIAVADAAAEAAGPPPQPKPGHHRGEALWSLRNARRARLGDPPMPRPANFDNYT
jgi:hypothetical protein